MPATWGYPDPHMTTPEGLHLDGATQVEPLRGSWTSIPRYPPPCSGRRTSSRNMGLLKWNPAGVITDRHKGNLYLAQSTLSAPRSSVELSQRKYLFVSF